MELTRTKHWGRVWSCVQSLMSPGILIGSGVTSYLGKPGFYACATCVLIGAGLIGFQLIDLSKCGSPQLSSSMDNDSPIPPAPPPISPTKYGTPTALAHHTIGGGANVVTAAGGYPSSGGGMYPLRRSISLQQPLYPCCRGESVMGDYPPIGAAPYTPVLGGMHHPSTYSPYCRECLMTPPPYGPTPPPLFPQMIRSYSLPQTAPLSESTSNLRLKTTGTQTNPNSPVHSPSPAGYSRMQPYPGSFDRIHAAVAAAAAQAGAIRTNGGFVLPEDRVIRDPPSISKSPRGAPQTTTAGGAPPSSIIGKSPTILHQQPTDTLRKFQPGYKSSVMFASNPQLFPASSSATSTTEERSSSRGGFDVSGTPTPTPHSQQQTPTTPNHVAHQLNGGSQAVPGATQRYMFPQQQQQQHIHGSTRDYYPQREERRATFLRSQQHQQHNHNHHNHHPQMSFESQKSTDSASIFPAQHHHLPLQRQIAPVSRFSVAVEQHKRPVQHQKSQESIGGGLGMERSPVKPPPPQTQKPSSSHSQPAFTRHYFDSSKILPAAKRKMIQHQKGVATPTISAQVHHQQQQQQRQPQQPHYYPRWTQPQVPMSVAKQFDPFADDPDPPYYPAALSHAQTHAYHRGGTPVKISSAEFNIEPPKFNSLRRPGTAQSGSIGGGGDTTRGSSISSQLNLTTGGGIGVGHHPQQPPQHHQMHQPYLPPQPIIHPSYTPSRARQYHPGPGAVAVYPPHPHQQQHHQHHPQQPPQLQQRHPLLHRPHPSHPQQHHQSATKNVSSEPSFTKNNQKTGQQSQQPPLHLLIHQPKSRQSDNGDGDEDNVEVDVDDTAASTSKKNSRDDHSRDFFLGGPTIINLPPTIISGASPCPYCDVRRPQSSLSETGGSSGGGRYHRYYRYHQPRLIPGYSLSLSVPALQHIYPSATPTRRHYCSPPSSYGLYDIRKRRDFVVPLPPPPHKRALRRRNTWHVPKDYLEQITTSV